MRFDVAHDDEFDCDVAVVGGGPAGCAVGVFTARAGLRTHVLNRGRSSIARCAYLENYLGFPAGIDVRTFLSLARSHAEASGCEYIEEMVTAVERGDDGFVVRTQEGRELRARRVVAAAKYDADYLEPLDVAGTMFTTVAEAGEEVRLFDREYPDADGRTDVPGLYVAGPLAGCVDQALAAAGDGTTVAFALLEDWLREERGYPPGLAERYWDWAMKAETADDWEEHVDAWVGDVLPSDADPERADRLRREVKAHWRDSYVTAEDAERRRRDGHRELVERLDDDVVLDRAAAIRDRRADDS